MRAALPVNEPGRLAAVERYAVLDTPTETNFDRLSRVAGGVFQTPIALISVLDGKRQFLKSRIGLDVTETSRDLAFCAHAILQGEVLVVLDAAADERFADNALVTGEPHIRFYAGAPLKTADGFNLGTLCVIDTVPRPRPSEEQLAILQDLSAQVVELLEAGKSRHEATAYKQRWLKTEKMAALALDAGNMGFWEWNAQTRLTRCSERMLEIIGVPKAETTDGSVDLLARVHPADRKRVFQALEQPPPGTDRLEVKFRIVDNHGAERHITLQGLHSFHQNGPDHDNVLLGALGIGWDSTDNDKKERALAESEDLFRGLSASCPVGIFRSDLNGKTVFANSRLAEIMHLDASLILGVGWRRRVHPEDIDSLLKEMKDWIQFPAERKLLQLESRLLLPDGSVRRVLFRVTFIHDKDGNRSGLVGTLDDITSQKRTLDELQAAKEAAELASRGKDLFVANVSHELRTPLNGVLGMSELLLATPLSSDQRDMAQTVLESGRSLLMLVNDILDLNRIEAGKLAIEEASFDLDETLRQTLAMIQTKASDQGLKLEIKAHRQIPNLIGDAGRIKQILLIYLSNALKFTSTGGITIDVMADHKSPAAWELLLTVRDTGPGIGLGQQAKLFQPFSQVDDSSSRKHGGIGLGLAIARRLAELMGGNVGVMSTPGEGATFWLRLTLARGARQIANEAATRSGTNAGEGRILVVEDNPINPKVAVGALRRIGWQCDVASDGYAALALIRQKDYSLILMDCQMPGLDGYNTTEQIRAWEKATERVQVPIVALTAHAMQGDRERCLQSGMNDYLPKPFALAALQNALARWAAVPSVSSR